MIDFDHYIPGRAIWRDTVVHVTGTVPESFGHSNEDEAHG